MSDQSPSHVAEPPAGPAPAPASPTATPEKHPAPPRLDKLPPYKVLLHNDDHTPMDFVVRAIRQLTSVSGVQARSIMMTAHTAGVALVLVTHKERAELYRDQFMSKGLTATIEPA
jgi:ATP-dependent Clp protease adaptor protein ClpS